jgi:hypothetical protein
LRSLTAWFWFLLVGAIAAFGIGLVLSRIYLCGQPGPGAFLVSIGLCAIAALLLFVTARRARSWRLAIAGLAAAGLTYALLFFSTGVTLSGCSGV